ncbi:MAG: hypothetical protein ABIN67_13705 [Ferruginibacter sp.]
MQPSDNDMDKLSKDAAEHFDPPGASPNWPDMELLLDKHLPQKKEPRRRIFILLFVLLFLLSAGGYLYYTNKNNDRSGVADKEQSNNTTLPQQNTTPVTNDSKSPGAPADDKTIPAGDDQKSSPNTIPLSVAPIQKNNGGINALPTTKDITKDITKVKSHRVTETKAGKTRVNISQAGVAEDNSDANSEETIIKNEVTTTPVTKADISEQTNTDNKTIDSDKKLTTVEPAIQPIAQQNKATEDSVKAPAKKGKAIATNKKRWEISLLYSPELTTIKWKHIDKPGSNYGILIGYGLSKKLTVQTGFVKSRKNYTANEEDFKFAYTSPTAYKFSNVSGYCDMYEIPLNLKYLVAGGKKINIVATGGISSYFMKKEFYTYHYHNSQYDWSALYNSTNNYWLAVATLGIGIEKDISKNLNIGVSPFVKIPFKGMGKGELKMQGAGINFLLTYKPVFTKKGK